MLDLLDGFKAKKHHDQSTDLSDCLVCPREDCVHEACPAARISSSTDRRGVYTASGNDIAARADRQQLSQNHKSTKDITRRLSKDLLCLHLKPWQAGLH